MQWRHQSSNHGARNIIFQKALFVVLMISECMIPLCQVPFVTWNEWITWFKYIMSQYSSRIRVLQIIHGSKSMKHFNISWLCQFKSIVISHALTYNYISIVTIYIIIQNIVPNTWGSNSRRYNAVGIFHPHALDIRHSFTQTVITYLNELY